MQARKLVEQDEEKILSKNAQEAGSQMAKMLVSFNEIISFFLYVWHFDCHARYR